MGVKIGDTTDYDCWVLVRSNALFGAAMHTTTFTNRKAARSAAAEWNKTHAVKFMARKARATIKITGR